MTQQQSSGSGRVVVCLFCGTRTFVPSSPARDAADQEAGPGITLVRCHVCRKEAPYGAREIFTTQEAAMSVGALRTRSAGL